MIVVFLAIGFCTYQFGIKPLLDERGEDIGRLLLPIIELLPFITVVPKNEVVVVWRAVRGSKSFTKVLKPGTYCLNPDLYKVDEVFTGK
jgi:predicted hydrocarbon binding protein